MAESTIKMTVETVLQNARQADSIVVVVGADISAQAGLPTWQFVLSQDKTASDADISVVEHEPESLAFKPAGRQRLAEIAAKLSAHSKPLPVHFALAELNPRGIVTTNYDPLIEDAIRISGKTATVLVPREATEITPDDAIPVFKVHGSPERPSTLSFRFSDSLLSPSDESYNAQLLKTMITVSLVIVIGFELDSKELGSFYERFGGGITRNPWFILSESIDPVSETLWASRGVHVVNIADTELSNFFETLKARLNTPIEAQKRARQRHQIFISHTGDESTVSTVRSILRNLDFTPVSVGDIASAGQTWMERLDDMAASSDAAIVILGPESTGSRAGLTSRSNIIFELGLLLGRLGRDRVLTIVTPDATLPSDLGGFRYLVVDPGRDDLLRKDLSKWVRQLSPS